MAVEAKNLRNFLLNDRAADSVTGNAASNGERKSKQLVAAAARLLPLPWDAMLGYGNPRREVTFCCYRRFAVRHCTRSSPVFLEMFT